MLSGTVGLSAAKAQLVLNMRTYVPTEQLIYNS